MKIKESGMEMGSKSLYRFSIGESNPLSAIAEYEWEWEYGRGTWQTKTHTYTRITSDLNHFYLYAVLIAWRTINRYLKRFGMSNLNETIFSFKGFKPLKRVLQTIANLI